MIIAVKRVYDAASDKDGNRILVDRLWPRGISRENAKINKWMKEIAPSTELRQWYNHAPEKWEKFKAEYFKELDNNQDLVKELCSEIKKGKVTVLFSSKEPKLNNAYALKKYLESKC